MVCVCVCVLGKSQFLKTLAGRMRREKRVTGELYFNGLTADEQLAAGQYIEKLCGFIQQGQTDHKHAGSAYRSHSGSTSGRCAVAWCGDGSGPTERLSCIFYSLCVSGDCHMVSSDIHTHI